MSRPKPRIAVRYTTVVRCGDQCPWHELKLVPLHVGEDDSWWTRHCTNPALIGPCPKTIEGKYADSVFPKFCPLRQERF